MGNNAKQPTELVIQHGLPVIPCALVMVTERQLNGDIGHYFLVRDYDDKHYQTMRIQDRIRFRANPTLLEKSGCRVILHNGQPKISLPGTLGN